jgi:phosphoribosylformylglycinamidine (FGAM) synthase-like enzyme
MADISVFTLQRFYNLPTIHVCLDARVCKALNTSEVSGRDSLQGLYKDSLTYDNPLRFQVKVVITLPNEVMP